MILAAQSYNFEVVELLLDWGADVHAQNDEALKRTRRVCIKRLLLDRGADGSVLSSESDSDSDSD